MRVAMALAGTALGTLGLPSHAFAYRVVSDRADFPGDGRVVWADGSVGYYLDSSGAPGVGFASTLTEVEAAVSTWAAPTCANVDFRYVGSSGARSAPDNDRNELEWVTSDWRGRGYSADVVAVTDLLFEMADDGSWEIREADIYFNAVDHPWAVDGSGGAEGDRRSVRAVVAHEAGHAIGLEHTCELAGEGGAPLCESPQRGSQDLMHPLYHGSASLSDDDAAGVCFLYPCPHGSCDSLGECAGDGGPCEPGTGDGVASAFDPCTVAEECRGSVCVSGHCAPTCSAGPCPAGGTCVVAETGGAYCQHEGSPFGALCEEGGDCASGVCISAVAHGLSACTRRCDESAAVPCPAGYQCSDVGDVDVCTPRTSTGCAVAPAVGRAMPTLLTLVLLFLATRRRT